MEVNVKCDFCRKRYSIGETCPFCGAKPNTKTSHVMNVVVNGLGWFVFVYIIAALGLNFFYYPIWGVLAAIVCCPVTYWIIRFVCAKKIKRKVVLFRIALGVLGFFFLMMYHQAMLFNKHQELQSAVYIDKHLTEKYKDETYILDTVNILYKEQNPKERYFPLCADVTYHLDGKDRNERITFYFDSIIGGFTFKKE